MNNNDRETAAIIKILKNALVSLGISLAACTALTVICTAVAMTAEHPRAFAFLGRCIFFAGAAVCGFVCGKRVGRQGFLCGVSAGALYCFTVGVISVAVMGEDGVLNFVIPLSGVAVSVVSSCVGCSAVSPKNSAPTAIKQKKTVRFKGGYNK